jgi:transposase InsO family protein
MDFVADNLFDGRKLRMLTVVDCYTRESLDIHVDQSLRGEDVVRVLNNTVATRGKPMTTPVTSPQSNGMAESFVQKLKRDYAKLANRPDSKTVMAQLKDWFNDYNSYHPHSTLGYLPPTLFR